MQSSKPVESTIQQDHGWNKDDKSPNLFVKEENNLTVYRHPVVQSTDGIRGRVGYSRGFHCWKIKWDTKKRGTHAVLGICTAEAPLTHKKYCSLIGMNNESWGWDITQSKLFHGEDSIKRNNKDYPRVSKTFKSFAIPETIFLLLDMDEGILSFVVNGYYLGVAFTGLKGKTLYPAISCVWGNCEIEIRYINGLERLRLDGKARKLLQKTLLFFYDNPKHTLNII